MSMSGGSPGSGRGSVSSSSARQHRRLMATASSGHPPASPRDIRDSSLPRCVVVDVDNRLRTCSSLRPAARARSRAELAQVVVGAREHHGAVDQPGVVERAVGAHVAVEVAVLGVPLHVEGDPALDVVDLVPLVDDLALAHRHAVLAGRRPPLDLQARGDDRVHPALAPPARAERGVEAGGEPGLVAAGVDEVGGPEGEPRRGPRGISSNSVGQVAARTAAALRVSRSSKRSATGAGRLVDQLRVSSIAAQCGTASHRAGPGPRCASVNPPRVIRMWEARGVAVTCA